jgi:hypothetical protein
MPKTTLTKNYLFLSFYLIKEAACRISVGVYLILFFIDPIVVRS